MFGGVPDFQRFWMVLVSWVELGISSPHHISSFSPLNQTASQLVGSSLFIDGPAWGMSGPVRLTGASESAHPPTVTPCALAPPEASHDTMKQRIQGRAQSNPGRVDDNDETVRKRLEVFDRVLDGLNQYIYIYLYYIPAASKGLPMDNPTLLIGHHWTPIGRARFAS